MLRIRSRQPRESGIASVELAFLLPLILMLIFGMISSGLAWNTKQNMTYAAREAARYGAALPPNGDWPAAVLDRAVTAAHGDVNEGMPDRYVCVAYVGDTPQKAVLGTPPADAPADSTCFDDGRPADEPRSQVVVQRSMFFNIIVWGERITIGSAAAARQEATEE